MTCSTLALQDEYHSQLQCYWASLEPPMSAPASCVTLDAKPDVKHP